MRFLLPVVATVIWPGLATAQQPQPQGAEATAGRPTASYAAHLAVWSEKCGLTDAAALREELRGTAQEGAQTFDTTFEAYQTEVGEAECTEERRAQTEALVAEFMRSGGSGQ